MGPGGRRRHALDRDGDGVGCE
ncbi:excalibur calcium-binding domain-containing protein [Streptomyces avidinii]